MSLIDETKAWLNTAKGQFLKVVFSINSDTGESELLSEIKNKDDLLNQSGERKSGILGFSFRTLDNRAALPVVDDQDRLIVNQADIAREPVLRNVSCPNAGQTYAIPLTDNVKRFSLRIRGRADTKLSFSSNFSNYWTLPIYGVFSCENLELNNKTIYLKIDRSNKVVELLEWV